LNSGEDSRKRSGEVVEDLTYHILALRHKYFFKISLRLK
jgi:hypothetical protein